MNKVTVRERVMIGACVIGMIKDVYSIATEKERNKRHDDMLRCNSFDVGQKWALKTVAYIYRKDPDTLLKTLNTVADNLTEADVEHLKKLIPQEDQLDFAKKYVDNEE